MNKNILTATFKTSLQTNYHLTIRNTSVKHITPNNQRKVSCQAVYNDMFVDDTTIVNRTLFFREKT